MERRKPRRSYCPVPRARPWGMCLAVFCIVASSTAAFDPLSGDYTRDEPLDIRVVTYNHHGNFISDPGRDAAFNRILTALDPDVICFQEFSSSVEAGEIVARLNSVLPVPGGSWRVHFGLLGGTRTIVASRFAFLMTRTDTEPESSTRGVTMALVNLPAADYPVDLYIMGVHLKCCGDPGGPEDEDRQRSADAIANWIGDARGVARPSGNNIVLPANTPIINLGDFNLVGGPQPEDTLITGDIQDEITFGPDVKGDWDGSDLTDLAPLDPFTGDDFTWQGSNYYPPSRLDRLIYTDSAVIVANSFVLNSTTMTPAARAALGLQADDTLPESSSDHLPVAMDLRLAVTLGNGDFDLDGDVDLADFAAFQGCFGSAYTPECLPADLTGLDRQITLADYVEFASRFTGP
ncbi:MAG: endonuclease/exonuclease/phosphatase family protein [Phycisphaerae bacterium]|nr:endonuclease/exonuclease/phosphatase family protein [Phycisphaerae bacterium]